MTDLKQIFTNNKEWAARQRAQDADYFERLLHQQTPEYLWIGCSDSRVPANQIMGLAPGEVFVHRNVANLVNDTDLNCLAVLQFAVEVLKVRHIIVTGHYGCGGVRAACNHIQHGLIDNWLRPLKRIYELHAEELDGRYDADDKLCELSVAQQVRNVAQTTIVQNAWKAGQALSVHGLVYRVSDGLLHDLDVTVSNAEQLAKIYRMT